VLERDVGGDDFGEGSVDEYRLEHAVASGDWDEVDRVLSEHFYFYLFEHPDLLDDAFEAAPPDWYERHPRNVMSRAIASAARGPMMLVDDRSAQAFKAWVQAQEHLPVRDLLGIQQPGMRALLATGRYSDAAAKADEALRLIHSSDDMSGFPDILPPVLLRCGTAKLLAGELDDAIAVYSEALHWATVNFEHPWARYTREYLAFAYALAEQYRLAGELLRDAGTGEAVGPGSLGYHYQEPGLLALALVRAGGSAGDPAPRPVFAERSGPLWWVPLHVRAISALMSGEPWPIIHELSQVLIAERVRSGSRTLVGAILRSDLATLQQSVGDLRHAQGLLERPGLSTKWPGVHLARARQEWLEGRPDAAAAMLHDHDPGAELPLALQAQGAVLYAEAELSASGSVSDSVVAFTASALNDTDALLGLTQASPLLRGHLAPKTRSVVDAIPVRFTAKTRLRLTRREQEVLAALADKLSIQEIAGRLHVSANTVKTHVRGLYQKLGAHNRDEALWLGRKANTFREGPAAQ
jgi:DNA-binding NarL/FixJ family response regulator